MALEHEIAVYRKRLPELLAHEGKFVVIHGNDIVGFADDLDGALDIGYGRFGTGQPFLVKRVDKVERVFDTNLKIISSPSTPESFTFTF
jgi:hypothetical protein